jgi:hypothetical protein
MTAASACGERFTGTEEPASGSSGAPNAGMSGEGGAAGGSDSTSGAAGADEGGGSDAGGRSSGGEGGSPGEVEPEIPTDGLVLWLRADRGVTQADGAVSQWDDGSGQGNHATQTASNVRPLFVAGAFGGRSAIAFGEDDFMRLPAGFSDFSQGLSVFALASFDEAMQCAGVFHLGNGPEVDDIELGHSSGSYHYEVGGEYPQADFLAFDASALLTVIHRPTLSVEMRWNQVLELAPSVMLPASVERTENLLGKSLYAGCTSLKGKLAELILYDRAVSDQELVDVEQYLQQRYDCCN